jgi:inosose dehydratase
LDSRGLKVAGTFAMESLEIPEKWPELERQVLGAGELLVELGAGFLVLIDGMYSDLLTGELVEPTELDSDAWKRLIDTTHRVADIAIDQFGLQLVFHPHAECHVEYTEQIETFLQQTDPERVGICLDVGHHAYRGGDAIEFMRQHHERIPYLHIKSVDRAVQQQVEASEVTFAEAVKMDMFVEPALGWVDYLAFRDVLRDVGFDGWAMVEQDMYPAPFDKPLPIAKRTRAYLRDIGIG